METCLCPVEGGHAVEIMTRFDIAIAGAGPAGLAFALNAANAGARVAVVGHPNGTARIEGASARVAMLLGGYGIGEDVLGPPLPRNADWPGLSAGGNVEHLVMRPALDAALMAAARRAGVTIVEDHVRRLDPGTGTLELEGGMIRAALLAEARGRRAPVGPRRRRGPATIAVAGFVDRPDGQAGSRVTAREAGWTWHARLHDRAGWMQVSVDAEDLRLRGPETVWADLTGGLPMPPKPLIRAAELRLVRAELEPGCVVLGDAAVAMDPLSGHGMFWALSSALSALPMARAMLDGETELAQRFYRERVIETFLRQARIGRDFHALAAPAFGEAPFWRARASWPDAAPAKGMPDERWLRRVIVRGGRLEEATVLATEEAPGGVAFVAGIEIGHIARQFAGHRLPDIPEFAARIAPDASRARVLAAHDWLTRQGFAGSPFPTTTSDAIQEVTT